MCNFDSVDIMVYMTIQAYVLDIDDSVRYLANLRPNLILTEFFVGNASIPLVMQKLRTNTNIHVNNVERPAVPRKDNANYNPDQKDASHQSRSAREISIWTPIDVSFFCSVGISVDCAPFANMKPLGIVAR